MDDERAISIIQTVLTPKSLNLVQIEIIRGVLAGESYQKIAKTAKIGRSKSDVAVVEKYQVGYIRETGAQLWQLLTLRLGTKVTKKNLAAVLLWYVKQTEYQAVPDRSERTIIDWGEGNHLPAANREIDRHFYGRTEELAILTDWCLSERCRTILAIGMGGMGKTTLVWEMAHQMQSHFEAIVWRSLLNLPPIADLCADLLQFLSPQPLLELPDTLEGRIELLINCFKRSRCLVILDNVESILVGGAQAGQYLPGYEGYDRFFRAIAELPHQSCVAITSREQPHTLARSQLVNPKFVRVMNVGGMSLESGHQLIQAYGCPQLPAQIWQEVHAHYGGNPLALKIATIGAVELTGGGDRVLELYPLMQQGQLPFRDIDDILARQFDRLSTLEQQLLYWLAIEREPVTGVELRSNLVQNTTKAGEIINALQALSRRCIAVCREQLWSIQPVMIAYVTNRSIDLFVAELSSPLLLTAPTLDLPQQFAHLNTYALLKAQTKDYLRQAQLQSIVYPTLDRALKVWGTRENLDRHLRQILQAWQTLEPIPPGYLAGNILNLLIELSPDRSIANLDCSALPITSAYLAAVNLHQVNFAAATFERSVFTQAFGGILFATYHPDGELLATSDANGDVSLWRVADGQRVAILQGHTNWTRALAFSNDGTLLASSSEDRTFRIWNVQTGEQLVQISHTHSFRGMKFSNDGTRAIVCCDDCQIRIYDVAALLAAPANSTVESHCLQVLSGHTNWVFSATYSPDERRMASASADGTVRIWDLATGNCLQILPHEHWTIRTLFSPDGRYLIASGMSATIYLWDTISGELVKTFNGHQDWIWSIEMSADGQTLYSTGEDRTIRSWDISTGNCQAIFRSHQQRIWTIAIAPDGRQLVSGSEDRTIKLWDLQQGKCVKTINGYGNWIKAIAFVPHKEWLVSCHRDRTVRIWDLPSRTCIHTLAAHTDAVLSIAVSPDGKYVASSSLDRTIRIWDLAEFTCIRQIVTTTEGICALAFSPNGDKLISGSYQGDLQIWETKHLANLDPLDELNSTLLSHPNRIEAVAICPIRGTIATACENKIRLWDLATGECIQTIFAHYLNVLTVAFSPDGRYLASGSMDKTAKVWDTSTWECWQTFSDCQSWVTTIAFSPMPMGTDYHLIASGGDRSICRWDLGTGERLQTYTGHTNWVWSLRYSPDGSQIVSAGEDETMRIWDIDRDRSRHTLQLKRPYEEMNISGAIGLRSGQRQTLRLLGAIDE